MLRLEARRGKLDIMLALASAVGCGLLIPGAPKASTDVVRLDRRAALAAAAAVVVAPASVFAEEAKKEEAKKEEPKKEEEAAPAKKKKDKGPEPNLGGPPMAKQTNALGFVTSEKAPQFRPTGATPSKPFKPPPLGKVRPVPTLGTTPKLLYPCPDEALRSSSHTVASRVAARPQEAAPAVFQVSVLPDVCLVTACRCTLVATHAE